MQSVMRATHGQQHLGQPKPFPAPPVVSESAPHYMSEVHPACSVTPAGLAGFVTELLGPQ